MNDADKAYEAAEKRIAEALESGAKELDFRGEEFRTLDRLPPQIGDLAKLQNLLLHGTRISDISALKGLSNLKALSLSETPIKDISALQTLSGLRALALGYTRVSDLTPLRSLSNLNTLTLGYTQIGDIAVLEWLRNLFYLSLRSTKVADIGPLRYLTNLTGLDLRDSWVSDLRPIADLPSLGRGRHYEFLFAGTLAIRDDPELARFVEAPSDPFKFEVTVYPRNEQRMLDLMFYLRTLPPWPEPLPWDSSASAQDTEKAETTQTSRPVPKSIPRRITASQARKVLETHSKDLREQCQFVTEEIQQTIAHYVPAKPNDPDQLAQWIHLVNTLELSCSAIATLHDALPDDAEDRPVTDADASRLKQAFEAAIAKLQEASAYIDGPGEAHGRTYAGLLKIGVCTALATPIALISAQPVAWVGAGLYALFYGKGQALDLVKTISAGSGSQEEDQGT